MSPPLADLRKLCHSPTIIAASVIVARLIGALIVARLIGALIAALMLSHPAAADPPWHNPVKVVADARLTVMTKAGTTPAGSGEVPLYLSADWSHPLPSVRRAVIVVHGVDRDAKVYLRSAEAARAAAGPAGDDTLLLVPQFLADIDVTTFHLPAAVLHWGTENWATGAPANGPAPLSSFDVFDAILQRLADPALLPNLARVVLAGHSAGEQVVQRYSVVGRGEAALAPRGLTLRYVVANPSSYLYFSADRPVPVDPAACPRFDRWRYGLAGARPMSATPRGSRRRSPPARWSICSARPIRTRTIPRSTNPVAPRPRDRTGSPAARPISATSRRGIPERWRNASRWCPGSAIMAGRCSARPAAWRRCSIAPAARVGNVVPPCRSDRRLNRRTRLSPADNRSR